MSADLRALVRRELAELTSSRAGRQASREETDNTLQFLRVLVDNGERLCSPPPQVVPMRYLGSSRTQCAGCPPSSAGW